MAKPKDMASELSSYLTEYGLKHFGEDALTVGTHNGCLTIMGVIGHYSPKYKVQCKCGKTLTVDHFHFTAKRHRFCDTIYDEGKHNGPVTCKLRSIQKEKQKLSAKRVLGKYYNTLPPFSIHESLVILGFGQDEEIEVSRHNKLTIRIERPYRCKCYLCEKEWTFHYDDFFIRDYAFVGYSSKAHCDCHIITSFQWRTIDILKKHSFPYRVEVSFDTLKGTWGKKPLRFDFGLYSPDGTLVVLMECQGQQHFTPVEDFGGEKAYSQQLKNDSLKRQFASNHNIPLVEIPYSCNTYAKEESFVLDQLAEYRSMLSFTIDKDL